MRVSREWLFVLSVLLFPHSMAEAGDFRTTIRPVPFSSEQGGFTLDIVADEPVRGRVMLLLPKRPPGSPVLPAIAPEVRMRNPDGVEQYIEVEQREVHATYSIHGRGSPWYGKWVARFEVSAMGLSRIEVRMPLSALRELLRTGVKSAVAMVEVELVRSKIGGLHIHDLSIAAMLMLTPPPEPAVRGPKA